MPSEVVTIRLPKELRQRARAYGIEIGAVARAAVADEVRKAEERALRETYRQAATLLQKVPEDVLVSVIRQARDRR